MSSSDKPKQTTQQCPKCGNRELVLIGTHHIKHCTDCNIDIPWYIEEGQTSIYGGFLQGEQHER